MNHDIIAAGHPALYFDYTTYVQAYPKHWRDSGSRDSDTATARWLAGQLTKADSELELVKSRLARKHPNSVWPEFSNLQCTSCHQNIEPFIHSRLDPITDSKAPVGLGKATLRMWNLDGLHAIDEAYRLNKQSSSELLDALLKSTRDGDFDNSELKLLLTKIDNKRDELIKPFAADSVSSELQVSDFWSLSQQRAWAREKWEAVDKNPNWEQAALAYLVTIPVLPKHFDRSAMDRVRSKLLFPDFTQSPRFPIDRHVAEPNDSLQSDTWTTDLSDVIESLKPHR